MKELLRFIRNAARDILVRSTIAGPCKRQYIHVLRNGKASLQRKVRPMNITQAPFAAGNALQRSQRITIYPNLVTQKLFWLQFYYVDKCVFSLHLYTLNGQEVFRKFFHHSTWHATHAVQLPFHLMTGIYKLAIRSERISYLQPIVIR